MSTRTTLAGCMLLVRIGYERRANVPYYPPASVMEECLLSPRTHDAKVLCPHRA